MPTIYGTLANDVLNGSAAADLVRGFSGADRIDAGGGGDTVYGGDGADDIKGGDGDDALYGFGGTDGRAGSGDIAADLIASGLDSPVFALSAPGDPDRLFVLEKDTGQIKILDLAANTLNVTPFLDIPDASFTAGGEQGALGLAFDPDYAANRKFYVYLVNANGDLEVRAFTRSAADPDLANSGNGDVILRIPHPSFGNHNGGWIGFGPDGMLYVATGDGGGGGDPANNAQNLNSLLGKILRIDVSSDAFPANANKDYAIPADNPFAATAGADEIWAYGLRNPWRPSFDRLTGDFYIADVGQGSWEEVNYQSANSGGGENYGWKVKEGDAVFDDTVPGNPPANSPSLIDPVAVYGHGGAPNGGFSITGGYVYRGQSAGMQGLYFYADFLSNQMWSFRVVAGQAVDVINRTGQLAVSGGSVNSISSFAEDGRGNLYVIGLDGEIHKLSPQIGAGDGGDRIDGGNGNDRLYGGAGRDLLMGGTGDDAVYGGSQNDALYGGNGADLLQGGDGSDAVTGGAGDDRLRGGAGADNFVFRLHYDRDTIHDFENDIDTIRIASTLGVATVSQALALAADVAGNVVFDFGGGDVLTVMRATRAELANDIAII